MQIFITLFSALLLISCRSPTKDSGLKEVGVDQSGNCILTCDGRDLFTQSNIERNACVAENATNVFQELPRCPYTVRFSGVNETRVRCDLTCDGATIDTVTTTDSRCIESQIPNLFDQVPRCGPGVSVSSNPLEDENGDFANGDLTCNSDGRGTWYITHARTRGMNMAPRGLSRESCQRIIAGAAATLTRKGTNSFFCMETYNRDDIEFHLYNRDGNSIGVAGNEYDCRKIIEGMLVLRSNDNDYRYELCTSLTGNQPHRYSSTMLNESGNAGSSGRFSARGDNIDSCNRELKRCSRFVGYRDLCGMMGFCAYPRSGNACENQ